MTEDQRFATILRWWDIKNDPKSESAAESGSYLAVLAAELALLEDYLAAQRRRDRGREFCLAICESLSKLEQEAAAAEAAVLKFYEKVAAKSVDQCAPFAPILLSFGTRPCWAAVAECIEENDALLRTWKTRRELIDSYEARRAEGSPTKPSPFE